MDRRKMSDDDRGESTESGTPAGEMPYGPCGEPTRLIYASADLLQGRREIWIEHGHEMYRLRLTSSGKLYLTK
jgi:hemin uptake protein HemP